MHIFQERSCICVDFQELKVSHYFKGEGEQYPGVPAIECHEQSFQGNDALKLEIEDFLQSVAASNPPRVSGEDGRNALNAANRISEIIAETDVSL